MRITVDIPENTLKELLEVTGKRKMSPAVCEAVEGYIRRLRVSQFGKKIRTGQYDLGLVLGAGDDVSDGVPGRSE